MALTTNAIFFESGIPDRSLEIVFLLEFSLFTFDGFQKQASEDSKVDPWTMLAKHKLEVERELRQVEGLNYLVVRPATVYGPGDRNGLGQISHSSQKHVSYHI